MLCVYDTLVLCFQVVWVPSVMCSGGCFAGWLGLSVGVGCLGVD